MKPNPWRGIATYNDANPQFPFCGRSTAILELKTLVDDNIACTIYGKSGVGKSSLLRAGFAPLMEKCGYMPVFIRLQEVSSEQSYLTYICARVRQTALALSYTFESNSQSPKSLYDFFANLMIRNQDDDVIFPLVIFDQIEETLIPAQCQNKMSSLLRDVYEIVEPGLNEEVYNVRFLFSIREDDLYLLEDKLDILGLISLKEIRYRLRLMTRDEAMEVIAVPGEGLFAISTDEVCNMILPMVESQDMNVPGYDVLLLSLVCAQIYEYSASLSHENITREDIEELLAKNVIQNFYNKVCANLSEDEIHFIETRLVEGNARRNVVPYDEFIERLPLSLLRSENQLTSTDSILQTITINHNVFVELIHDRLAKVVFEQKTARRVRQSKLRRIKRYSAWFIVLLLLTMCGVLYSAIYHQCNIPPIEWNLAKEDTNPLHIDYNEDAPDEFYKTSYTSVDVNFFHPYLYSYGNVLYRYDQGGEISWPCPSAAEVILPSTIPYFAIGECTRKIILLESPSLYEINKRVFSSDSCVLYIPNGSMRLLLANESIDCHAFVDIHEMSLLKTWWLQMKLACKREFHNSTAKTPLGGTKLVTPASRFYHFALACFLCWLCAYEEKKNSRKKKRNLWKSFALYCIIFVVSLLYSYILFQGFRLNGFLPVLLPLIIVVIVSEIRKRDIVTKWVNRFIGVVDEADGGQSNGLQRISRLPFAGIFFISCCLMVGGIALFWEDSANELDEIIGRSIYIMGLFLLYSGGRARCHDIGLSGWWQLLPIFPMFHVYLLFKAGDPMANKYGGVPATKKGRLSRKHYLPWALSLLLSIIMFFLTIDYDEPSIAFFALSSFLYCLVHGFAILRCHDIGFSGKRSFIPFYIFVLMFKKGDSTENDYGKPEVFGRNREIFAFTIFFIYIIICTKVFMAFCIP